MTWTKKSAGIWCRADMQLTRIPTGRSTVRWELSEWVQGVSFVLGYHETMRAGKEAAGRHRGWPG